LIGRSFFIAGDVSIIPSSPQVDDGILPFDKIAGGSVEKQAGIFIK
jgi:hypothetical protein